VLWQVQAFCTTYGRNWLTFCDTEGRQPEQSLLRLKSGVPPVPPELHLGVSSQTSQAGAVDNTAIRPRRMVRKTGCFLREMSVTAVDHLNTRDATRDEVLSMSPTPTSCATALLPT
jgi:hypothetical protein